METLRKDTVNATHTANGSQPLRVGRTLSAAL